jgi:hypothetical protein
MARRLAILAILLASVGGASYGVYVWKTAEPDVPHVPPPEFKDNTAVELPKEQTFDHLAEENPIQMLQSCLSRYSREVKGYRAVLVKEETTNGKAHPKEVIQLAVKGEVADPAFGDKPKIHVRMVWQEGMRSVFGFPVKGTLYVEGENRDEMLTWRPTALLKKENLVSTKSAPARDASRYCIRDIGFRTVMLRTLTAYEKHHAAGTLKYEYLGRRPIPELNGRVCHVLRRINPSLELDGFALDEQSPTDAAAIEKDGFTTVTTYVDAERWIQIGTELRRGDTVVGAYYYKDVELNPSFPADTFTPAGLKAAK